MNYSINSISVKVLLISSLLSGCASVELTQQGSQVRLIPAESAGSCTLIGKTTSTVTDHIGPFYRSEKKVKDELAYLAKNRAAGMQGNAISPIDKEWNGSQSFNIYKCGEPGIEQSI